MIHYILSESHEDLEGILSLQQANHKDYLDDTTKKNQGFVTVKHSFESIKALNDIEKHLIAKENNVLVAYVLAMTKKSKDLIPILVPMFNIFDSIEYNGKKISEHHYLVVGQVCVDESQRGKGVFAEAYHKYREQYDGLYDFCITEIASTNTRSIKAQEKLGFESSHRYVDAFGIDWLVVVWDWKKNPKKE